MRVSLILAGVILFLSSCAGVNNTPTQISDLNLLDYGLMKINVKKTIEKSTTASGKYNVTDGVEFIETTSNITAKKKTTFGIKYQVNGTPTGRKVDLTVKIIHPKIKGKTVSTAKVKGTIGSWRSTFYTFDEDYELVEGEWRIQVWFENSMLLEKAFMVRK
jgi:hypothetical protein